MQFSTKIPIEKFSKPISYDSKILSLGSCFAENIGAKLDYFKFENTTNPFGIIFNPVSLEKLILRIVNQIAFTEADVFYHNDLWHCYEVHSELSNPNKELFLKELNSLIFQSFNHLVQTTHCLITLGTAWVYRNNYSGEIVANCHKVPQKQFTKELLSIATIEKSIKNIVALVHQMNKNVKFIFTISPVRHIKDGFMENNVSKAHLLSAINEVLSSRAESRDAIKRNVQSILDSARTDRAFTYFPSYEIVMDELRDYRFYAEDMLHPNAIAIQYIWQRFKENVISEEVYKIMDEVETIQKGLQHRPFNPNSESHQKFLKKLTTKIQLLHNQFPFLEF